jgi:hypothetical protein
LEDLLRRYEGVFTMLVGLPMVQRHSHQIRLLPGTTPVNMRAYRYAHLQKEDLESQCADMLHQGVIRPSSSVFSVPVLLMKKHDGS